MSEETQQVIASTHTGTLATINADGSPYATPLTYEYNNGIFTWYSAADAVHSRNIVRDGRVSFAIVEKADGNVRAVYINAIARATGESKEFPEWQQTLNQYSLMLGELDTEKSTPGRFYYKGNAA